MKDHEAAYHPYIAGISVTVLVVIVVFYVVAIYLLLHRDYRELVVQKLAANSMIGHLLFSILEHPMSIHLYLLYKPITGAACWLLRHLYLLYLLITPYTLFMITIERLIYIRNPTTHAQKFGRVSVAVMLALPWVIALCTDIIAFVFLPYEVHTEQISSREWDFNETMYVCKFVIDDIDGKNFLVRLIVVATIAAVLPLLSCLVITIVVLVMWCCYKRKHSLGTDYALMGNQIEISVRNSVIAVSLLNFLYIIVQIFEAAFQFTLPLRQAGYTIYGVIEAAVLLGTLDNVRKKIKDLYCSCSRKRQEDSAVEYVAKDEDTVPL